MVEWHFKVNGVTLIWMGDRPKYCNRGRWHASLETGVWISGSDWWPRYYFDLESGKNELVAWLNAHGIKTESGEWVEVDPGISVANVELNSKERFAG